MKKNGKTLGIVLIAVLAIACIVLVIIMMTSGEKETYYGIMKDSKTVEKMVREKDNHIEENVKIQTDDQFQPKKGDFVLLVKKKDSDEFSKKKVVQHDDIPHGLMMKIHDMKH
ncbi:DUF4889 domain-containing protein [Staphylococcus sp. IVB6181]|uniref:DUF4889 domain-containing protein n=1 Tax=Staphylococcus sp. IVB6181 TaxID=2929481 RepID=UPI0021D001FE|nr:DUF4889 domain-containing protein [Staphylococcus sp. IVB6181]UXV35536.1 DUF4889 domain-containing protein [Staphylococcus sp. IVB6181]